MVRVDLAHDAFILFSPSDKPRFAHVAFRVDVQRFHEIVERLRLRGIPLGNDPNDAKNGMTDDFLGGAGRVYFTDDNGHLWEVARSDVRSRERSEARRPKLFCGG